VKEEEARIIEREHKSQRDEQQMIEEEKGLRLHRLGSIGKMRKGHITMSKLYCTATLGAMQPQDWSCLGKMKV